MSNIDDLYRWDREHFWHPFTQMADYEPLVIERAEGCTLYDIEGRAYLDGVGSLWCNLHGHRHPRLDAALREQLDRVAHTTALGASNVPAITLAKRLTEIAPPGLEHVFFSDSGATAVEVALKLAFQYWRQRPDPRPAKSCYVAFTDGYHGDTLGSVSVGGVERFHAMFAPLLFETLRLPAPQTYRLPPGVNAADACGYYLAQAEELLRREHARIAAVVIEPLIQCAAGILTHPSGYLRGLRELTRRYNVLLIADEVAVGFGRTGRMFACEHEDVTPDLLCLAKGLTGGYLPLAATLATDELWQAFLGPYEASRQFYHGHTYCGNPLGAAVALASLDVFAEEQTLAKLPAKVERLEMHLRRIAQHPNVGDVRGRGLIRAIELVEDRATARPFAFRERRGHLACRAARERGVLLRPLGNTLVMFPPLSISLDEIDQLMLAIEHGIEVAMR
ncbi:MAG: adenosylmethionine--8-amino-7-oxononanoate transaminase [Pirellula sp.]|nr:adenosylmethionine--8-amino-7-oxononanoate transaminase [Pirellula sp.]